MATTSHAPDCFGKFENSKFRNPRGAVIWFHHSAGGNSVVMNLPVEVVERIFLALDARNLIACGAACSSLRAVLLDSTFARTYMRIHYPRHASLKETHNFVEFLLNDMNVERIALNGQLEHGPFSDRLCNDGQCVYLRGVDTLDKLLEQTLTCGSRWVCTEWRRCLNTSFILHEWDKLTDQDGGGHCGELLGAKDAIEYGVALISSAFAPQLNLTNLFARLDELASQVEDTNDGLELIHRAMKVMRANDIGPAFGERYYELNNSLIHLLVCKGGRGIPVSLSMVLRSILLRKKVNVNLLDMPGHYVMSYEATGGQLYVIDVYNNTVQVSLK
jgi:hypothetical protein